MSHEDTMFGKALDDAMKIFDVVKGPGEARSYIAKIGGGAIANGLTAKGLASRAELTRYSILILRMMPRESESEAYPRALSASERAKQKAAFPGMLAEANAILGPKFSSGLSIPLKDHPTHGAAVLAQFIIANQGKFKATATAPASPDAIARLDALLAARKPTAKADPKVPTTPAEKLAHYRTLKGAERMKYYGANADDLFAASRAANS